MLQFCSYLATHTEPTLIDFTLPSTVQQGSTEGTLCGPGAPEEGRTMAQGPPQPLSRSLPGGKNPVSVLMEYSQHSGNAIEFMMTGQAGPPHDTRYWLPPLPLKLPFVSAGPRGFISSRG